MHKQKRSNWIAHLLYGNDTEILFHPKRANMDGFLLQVICNISYGILAGGVFLSGYLIYLDLPDKLLSFVTSAQMICGMFMVLFVPWLDKKCRRKHLMMSLCAISRLFQLSIILVPLFLPKELNKYVVVICLFFGATVAAISDIVFNTWFAEAVPEAVKGRFYSMRQRLGVVVSLVVSLLASAVVDIFQKKLQYPVFLVIYSIAMLVTFFEILAMRKIDDVKLTPNPQKLHLLDVVRVPTKNKNFMRYMLLCCLLYLFLFLSSSFNTTFQLKYLQMSYTYINVVGSVRWLLQIFIFYKVWGLICDKIGNNFTLFFSICFNIVDCVLWSFMSTSTMNFIYPLMCALSALGQTGFAVALFNRRYELIPKKGKVVYETFFSAAIGVTVLIGPLAGSVLRDFFATTKISQLEFGNIRIVYLVSAILLIFLQIGHARSLYINNIDNPVLTTKNLKHSIKILFNVILRRNTY